MTRTPTHEEWQHSRRVAANKLDIFARNLIMIRPKKATPHHCSLLRTHDVTCIATVYCMKQVLHEDLLKTCSRLAAEKFGTRAARISASDQAPKSKKAMLLCIPTIHDTMRIWCQEQAGTYSSSCFTGQNKSRQCRTGYTTLRTWEHFKKNMKRQCRKCAGKDTPIYDLDDIPKEHEKTVQERKHYSTLLRTRKHYSERYKIVQERTHSSTSNVPQPERIMTYLENQFDLETRRHTPLQVHHALRAIHHIQISELPIPPWAAPKNSEPLRLSSFPSLPLLLHDCTQAWVPETSANNSVFIPAYAPLLNWSPKNNQIWTNSGSPPFSAQKKYCPRTNSWSAGKRSKFRIFFCCPALARAGAFTWLSTVFLLKTPACLTISLMLYTPDVKVLCTNTKKNMVRLCEPLRSLHGWTTSESSLIQSSGECV